MTNFIEVEGKAVSKDSIIKLEFNTALHRDKKDYTKQYYRVKVTYIGEDGSENQGWINVKGPDYIDFVREESSLLRKVQEILPRGEGKVFTLETFDKFAKRLFTEKNYNEV